MLTQPESPAIFQADGSVYEADSCVPLERALAEGAIEGAAWARGQYPGRRLEDRQLPGLRTIGCWDVEREQDWFIPPHRNEGIEISAILSGAAGFETGGRRDVLTRGQVALTAPWQEHCFGRPGIGPSRLVYIILDVGVRRPNATWRWPDWYPASGEEKRALGRRIARCGRPVFAASPEMIWAFERIFELLRDSDPGRDAAAMCLHVGLVLNALGKLLAELPQIDPPPSDTHHAVQLFLDGLGAHLAYPWRLDEMAKQCGLSRTRMAEVCFELTNMSPVEYLNEQRLQRAAGLLAAPDGRSITEIAFETGFGSSQYFSRRFSKRFGASPRGWARRNHPHGD